MKLIGFVLYMVFCVVCFGLGWSAHPAPKAPIPKQCQVPVNTLREKELADDNYKWQKQFDKMYQQWKDCTHDLARDEKELNGDIMCSDGMCDAE
jgi:hypothetical protein